MKPKMPSSSEAKTTSSSKKKRTSSRSAQEVVLRPPGTFLCLRCGESYAMVLPAPIDVMLGAMKAFSGTHKKCKRNKDGELACPYCFGFGHAKDACPKLKYHGDYREWMAGPDTGSSSLALCRKLSGAMTDPFAPTPADGDDFGRCHRLLHAIPGWRARIGEMATVKGWEKLAPAWDELEALYVKELGARKGFPMLYARMKELRGLR